MWLIACGMNRSGSTVQYQIAVKIAQTQRNTQLVGWVSPAQTAQVLGAAKDDASTWYLAKLHDYDDAVDAFWNKFHPKALYIYRDIRDVVVSTMHMENWAFDSPEIGTTINRSLRNYRFWSQKPGILISCYEELMTEGGVQAEVQKIANYMGVELPVAEIERITDEVSIKSNKRYIEQFDYEKKGVKYPNTRFDPASLFHNNHIRSGETEQWRTELTPDQVALVETWAGDWLKELGYPVENVSDAEQVQRLRHLLEVTQQKLSEQTDKVKGLEAYFRGFQPTGSDTLSEAELNELDSDAAREKVTALNQRVRDYELQLAILRNRKIVRIMAKLGRPLL
jgi:hypothetical protein